VSGLIILDDIRSVPPDPDSTMPKYRIRHFGAPGARASQDMYLHSSDAELRLLAQLAEKYGLTLSRECSCSCTECSEDDGQVHD
jgi:hypothetical protein